VVWAVAVAESLSLSESVSVSVSTFAGSAMAALVFFRALTWLWVSFRGGAAEVWV